MTPTELFATLYGRRASELLGEAPRSDVDAAITLYRECLEQATKAELTALLRSAIRQGIMPHGMGPAHQDILKSFQEVVPKKDGTPRGPRPRFSPGDLWFVTLSPPPGIDPQVVNDTLARSFGKAKWVKSSEWVVEQRSDDGANPQGWHFHVCMHLSTSMLHNKVIDKVAQMVRNYMQRSSVDVKPLESRHYGYVRGQKSEEKIPAVLANREARRTYGFKDLYGNFPWSDFFPGVGIDGVAAC